MAPSYPTQIYAKKLRNGDTLLHTPYQSLASRVSRRAARGCVWAEIPVLACSLAKSRWKPGTVLPCTLVDVTIGPVPATVPGNNGRHASRNRGRASEGERGLGWAWEYRPVGRSRGLLFFRAGAISSARYRKR